MPAEASWSIREHLPLLQLLMQDLESFVSLQLVLHLLVLHLLVLHLPLQHLLVLCLCVLHLIVLQGCNLYSALTPKPSPAAPRIAVARGGFYCSSAAPHVKSVSVARMEHV